MLSVDFPKKKGDKYRYLSPFVIQSGGLGSIERSLETRTRYRFYVFLIRFVPPFVPPFWSGYPPKASATRVKLICPIHQRWAGNQQANGQHGRNGGPLVRLSAWVDALAALVRLQRMPPAGFTSNPFRPIISGNPAPSPRWAVVGVDEVAVPATFPAALAPGFF